VSTLELVKVCSSQLLEVDSKKWLVALGIMIPFCALYSKLASISLITDLGVTSSLNKECLFTEPLDTKRFGEFLSNDYCLE
jgi:hypothetical protein